MMDHPEKQTAFLTRLMQRADTPKAALLANELRQLQGHVRCCQRAILLMVVLAGLAAAIFCFGVILHPEFFHQYGDLAQFLAAVVLACVISGFTFLGTWFWYRSRTSTVQEECRKLLLQAFDGRPHESHRGNR